MKGVPRRVARKVRRGVAVMRLAAELWRARPAFLYVNTLADPAPLQAARCLGVPVLVHFRDSPSYLRGGSRFTEARRRLILQVPDRFLACSHAAAADLIAGGVSDGCIEVIHNGIDPERFRPNEARRVEMRARLGLAEEQVVVGFVGGLLPGKGADTVIRAAGLLRERAPHLRYLIAGGPIDSPYVREVIAPLRDQVSVGDLIQFLGPTAEVPAILDACDLVAVASVEEQFGRVNVEAMSMMKPVVATRVGGIPEVVSHGETGFLVPPADPGALANRIAFLAQRPEVRRRLGARGREVVNERFTESRYVREVEDALRRFARDYGDSRVGQGILGGRP